MIHKWRGRVGVGEGENRREIRDKSARGVPGRDRAKSVDMEGTELLDGATEPSEVPSSNEAPSSNSMPSIINGSEGSVRHRRVCAFELHWVQTHAENPPFPSGLFYTDCEAVLRWCIVLLYTNKLSPFLRLIVGWSLESASTLVIPSGLTLIK